MSLDSDTENQMLGSAQPAANEGATPENGVAADGNETTNEQLIQDWKARAAKADEHWDRLLRARADLENYRKRTVRERQEAVQAGQASFLERMLPALDSLDMALAAANSSDGSSFDALKKGLELACQQLKASLAESGVVEIDATNQAFDPNLHEALAQQESVEVPEGHVLQQIRKGYKFRERLVRPASVIVAKPPAA